METKRWFHSKTLWANILVGVAFVVLNVTGVDWLDVEVQVSILAIINLILRILTKQGLGK